MNAYDDLLINPNIYQKIQKKRNEDYLKDMILHRTEILKLTSDLLLQEEDMPFVSNDVVESFYVYIRNCIRHIKLKNMKEEEECKEEEEDVAKKEEEEEDEDGEKEDDAGEKGMSSELENDEKEYEKEETYAYDLVNEEEENARYNFLFK